MNEPTSFGTNELKPRNLNSPEDQDNSQQFTLKCPNNKLDDPPYRTSYFNFRTFQFLMISFKCNCQKKKVPLLMTAMNC